MRIAISALNLSFEKGFINAGMSRYCFGLIEALRQLPDQHEYLIFVNRGLDVPRSWRQDSRFHFFDPWGPFGFKRTTAELVGASLHVLRLRPDVYLSTSIALPWYCPCPKALVVHDLFPESHPELFTPSKAKMLASMNRKAMGRAEAILANSEHTKSEIQAYYPWIDPAKIRVVYLGLGNIQPAVQASDVDDAELRRIGISSDRYIFTIGTLEPRKNLPRLIEAFGSIVDRIDPDIGLAIAGGKGWKESGIFESLKRSGLQDRIDFLGYVDDCDVPKCFARSEFFVFPSTIEGFGIPSLEAHHFGAPLVSSNTGALPEVAGPNAILFNPNRTEEIAEALLKGLAQGHDRARLVEESREFASGFGWERCARETLDVLVEIGSK